MVWRDIHDSDYYEVSDTGGLIRSKRTGRTLIPSDNGRGILKVILSEDGDQHTRTVARIVGEAFVDGYDEGLVIFHMDDDKSNCDASNLQWRPRWFAQEWAGQAKRDSPMRPWKIKRMPRDGGPEEIYENSLECALRTYAIERYIVLACGRDTIYNNATYVWIKE